MWIMYRRRILITCLDLFVEHIHAYVVENRELSIDIKSRMEVEL